jgi:hypothetical protein
VQHFASWHVQGRCQAKLVFKSASASGVRRHAFCACSPRLYGTSDEIRAWSGSHFATWQFVLLLNYVSQSLGLAMVATPEDVQNVSQRLLSYVVSRTLEVAEPHWEQAPVGNAFVVAVVDACVHADADTLEEITDVIQEVAVRVRVRVRVCTSIHHVHADHADHWFP